MKEQHAEEGAEEAEGEVAGFIAMISGAWLRSINSFTTGCLWEGCKLDHAQAGACATYQHFHCAQHQVDRECPNEGRRLHAMPAGTEATALQDMTLRARRRRTRCWWKSAPSRSIRWMPPAQRRSRRQAAHPGLRRFGRDPRARPGGACIFAEGDDVYYAGQVNRPGSNAIPSGE